MFDEERFKRLIEELIAELKNQVQNDLLTPPLQVLNVDESNPEFSIDLIMRYLPPTPPMVGDFPLENEKKSPIEKILDEITTVFNNCYDCNLSMTFLEHEPIDLVLGYLADILKKNISIKNLKIRIKKTQNFSFELQETHVKKVLDIVSNNSTIEVLDLSKNIFHF